jgi:Flp pilus assembly protein TadG
MLRTSLPIICNEVSEYQADGMESKPQAGTSAPGSHCLLGNGPVRAVARVGRSTSGNTLVELAFVLPMFVLLLLSVADFSRLFYVEMTLQNAVREAGRYAITGNHAPDPSHHGQNLSRTKSIQSVAQRAAMGLDVSNLQIVSAVGGKGSAGGPGDTVTISLTTELRLLTPIIAQFFKNGDYTFTVSVSFKNEPFPPANTAAIRGGAWQANLEHGLRIPAA